MDPTPWRDPRVIVLSLVLVTILVLGGFAVWYVLGRPWSFIDILNAPLLTAGETWDLEDTVESAILINTSYGTRIALALPGDVGCIGDVIVEDSNPRAGDRVAMPIPWESYTFNGLPAVWSDALLCPFPIVFTWMGIVIDAVSAVGGLFLAYDSTDGAGWTTYEVLTPNGDRLNPDLLPVALYRGPTTGPPLGTRIDSAAEWIQVATVEYLWVSGLLGPAGAPALDQMNALRGTSQNGTMQFQDVDGDGDVSDGDRLSVRFGPVAERAWQTYVLTIGDFASAGPRYAIGAKYIVQGSNGPFEVLPPPGIPIELEAAPYAPWGQLLAVSEAPGAPVVSTLRIGRTRGLPVPTSTCSLSISTSAAGQSLGTGRLGTGPLLFPGGISINVTDGNGFLDTGDQIVVSGLTSNVGYRLDLHIRDGARFASITWYAGYGHVSGGLPDLTLESHGGNPYAVAASTSFPHEELAFGKTVEVSLWENGSPVLDGIALGNGTLGTFSNGTLTFVDLDGDLAFSTGDEFRLTGTAGFRYRLRVSALFGDKATEIEFVL